MSVNKDIELFEFMNKYEEYYKREGYKYIAGIDEVGRGPLAGPLVVAGVILEEPIYGLKDSKKLSKAKIKSLSEKIKQNCYNYCIKEVSVEMIEEKGIKGALTYAMNYVADNLNADFYLVDYEKISKSNSFSFAKGDSLSNSIAAASIIAKDYRDSIMCEIAEKYPVYDFDKNVGYGTKKHREMILKHGYIIGVHRRNFNPVKKIIEENK